MSQQLSPKLIVGNGFPPRNNPGPWQELIDVVEFDTRWAMISWFWIPTSGHDDGNIEIGIGPLDQEERKWKSFCGFTSGGGLEFDDTGHVKYIPFNFKKGDRVSVAMAGVRAFFGVTMEIQLQLFSF
jgi:hypothetical protein